MPSGIPPICSDPPMGVTVTGSKLSFSLWCLGVPESAWARLGAYS